MTEVIVVVAVIAIVIYALYLANRVDRRERENMPEPTPEEVAMVSESNVPAEELENAKTETSEMLNDLEKRIEDVATEKAVIEERLGQIENPDKNKPFAKIGGVAAPKEETSVPKKKRKYKPRKKGNTPPADSSAPVQH